LPGRDAPRVGREDALAALERRVEELERGLTAIKKSLGIE
jgi:exonuclease VII small subunit